MFIALGSCSVILAEIIRANNFHFQKAEPFPSVADCLYLLMYPLILAGVLFLPHRALNPSQRQLTDLDRIIILSVFGIFMWQLVLSEMLDISGGTLERLVMTAYPMGDMLILMGLVTVIQRGVKGVEPGVLIFLYFGIILQIMGDTVFAIAKTYPLPGHFFTAVNFIWITGKWSTLAFVILLARQKDFKSIPDENIASQLRNGMFYAAVLGSVGLAFAAMVGLNISDPQLFGTLCGTLGVGTLVLLRQFFVMRDNRSLYAEMEQLALTDALTGLPNRRNFDESLEREIVRALRYDRPLSLLLIDVDQFKQYNDRYGHPAGDALLQNIARLLKTQLRSTDMVGRMGGDEFVVILPETDGKMSGIVVEKLRYVVQAGYMTENGIGISVGCATLQPKMSAGVLLELADKAMYIDKSNKQMVR